MGYAPGGGSVLTFLAQDQKLFNKEGVEVELVQFASSSDGLNALNSGKIDIGVSFGTAGPLTFITKGSDFSIIGGQLAGGHRPVRLRHLIAGRRPHPRAPHVARVPAAARRRAQARDALKPGVLVAALLPAALRFAFSDDDGRLALANRPSVLVYLVDPTGIEPVTS